MALGDGWTSQFIAGLAQDMENNGIGAWRPDGTAYTASETAIVDTDIPPEPDRLITLTAYLVSGTPGMLDVVIGVQFRMRGTTDPRSLRDIYDAIYERYDSCGQITLGDIAVVDASWRSHAPLGQDSLSRREASTNFYFAAMWPTPNRTR